MTQATNIPDIFVGNVSFIGNGGTNSSYSFASGAVTVTGRGFSSSTDLTLKDAKLSQNSGGLGVASSSSPYHNIANEVDFRKTADGQAASEELIIKLEDGKISYGAKIDFEFMYGGELEVGVAEFYRGGVLVSTQTFSSNASSGNYAANFEVLDGGFDKIIIKATDNGNSFSIKDNSDFAVSGIEFLGTTSIQPIAYTEGTILYGFGADGEGSIGLTGNMDNVTTLDGKAITITSTSNEILAKDSLGNLVFQLQLTPSTGKWEYYQYQKYLINDGVGKVLDVEFKVTDSDGDRVLSSIKIGSPAISSIDETNTLTFGKATTNLLFTLDVSGSMNNKVLDSNGQDTTRFKIAKESIITTIQAYKANGTTEVNLTLFNSGAKNIGWMSTDAAISYLNKLTMDSYDNIKYNGNSISGLTDKHTDYYDGLNATMNINFTEHKADNTVAYFLSDGAPNDNKELINEDSDATIVAWKNYVNTNINTLYVVGVGSGAQIDPLKIVQVQDGDKVIMATTDATLGDILLSTVSATILGNVNDNLFGGSGNIKIDSIIVDGVEYTKTTFPTDGITLDGDGKLVFNFDTGVYSYSAKSSEFTTDITKTFEVHASDTNGDSASFDVNLKMDITPNETVTTFDINSDADTIDLTSLINNNTTYKGVTDIIDMTNNKVNTLKIDMKDVIDLVDSDKQLVIKGDLDDKVDLDTPSDWTNAGKEQLDGFNYKVYTGTGVNSTIKLLIEDDIDITPDI